MKATSRTMTPEVDAMRSIAITGNVIPEPWYDALRFPSGKVNLNAIVLLAEIVYWYRPTEIRDEGTGKLTGYHRKFAADLLQKSYTSLAQKFGLSKRQVKDALKFLESRGLIDLVFRSLTLADGLKLSNVLFIRLYPDKLREVTHPDTEMSANVIPITFERNTPPDETSEGVRLNVRHIHRILHENTPKTSIRSMHTEKTFTGEEENVDYDENEEDDNDYDDDLEEDETPAQEKVQAKGKKNGKYQKKVNLGITFGEYLDQNEDTQAEEDEGFSSPVACATPEFPTKDVAPNKREIRSLLREWKWYPNLTRKWIEYFTAIRPDLGLRRFWDEIQTVRDDETVQKSGAVLRAKLEDSYGENAPLVRKNKYSYG